MNIRNEATQRQVDAADPATSTWLSANAGSGKTRVLTDRVARLLLEGVEPQNILCLTYTKAAAAEMQNRLFKRLGAWAMMQDSDLRQELDQLGFDRGIDTSRLSNARQLFARAIETPGGLKIQTIHSFCSSVLRRFPLEAQISPQFREIEDGEAERLREEVLDGLVSGPDAEIIHRILKHFSGADLGELARDISGKEEQLCKPFDGQSVRTALDLAPNMTGQTLVDHVFGDGVSDVFVRLLPILAKGSSTEVKAAEKLSILDWKAEPALHDISILEDVLLTGEGAKSPFTAKIDSFPTKATRHAHPELIEDLNSVMESVQESRQDRLSLIALDRTEALYEFAQKFIPAYALQKQAVGALDFDDLIRKTKALLHDKSLAQWVLFRLDGGIDHVLVDEAQDTSPDQWEVIRQLTQEFTSGEGAHAERTRTVFVVGDQKQSIYSFQGAAPEAFDQMRSHFDTSLRQVNKPLAIRELAHSFRSSEVILRLVDQVFGNGAEMGSDASHHLAFKSNMPGRVDVWPTIEKVELPDKENWFDPVDELASTDHIVQMAERVADQIQYLIANETLPEEINNTGVYDHRPISEGDFLILVRGRKSGLFGEIIRACKAAGLQIAGADRLRIGAEMAVRDILSLLSFLALPEDDLSLASAMRSPLFSWSEKQIYDIAQTRPKGAFLWAALRGGAESDQALLVLNDLRKNADFLRPYELIERILTRHDGRRNIIARLGSEAEDGIDALLSQALNYEKLGVPSLTGFLAWMDSDDLEIKRQMDSQGDKIRVMTVHGAKGLEAPIVILPDTGKRKDIVRAEFYPAGNDLIWKTSKSQSSDAVLALRDKISAADEKENNRLLYVAMTRAEKWLIVGAAGDVGEAGDSWYQKVAVALNDISVTNAQSGELIIHRASHGEWNSGQSLSAPATIHLPLSPIVFGEVPTIQVREVRSPSDLGGAKALTDGQADEYENDTGATERGTAIHLLLEHLPLSDTKDRDLHAKSLLRSIDWPLDKADQIISEVIDLLDHPDLASLWSKDHLREVEVTAEISKIRYHGTIDLLLISEDRVRAIDYKSNRLVPATAAETPDGILSQMAVYDAALSQIFPKHSISVAILWTQTATVMELPPELLTTALSGISAG